MKAPVYPFAAELGRFRQDVAALVRIEKEIRLEVMGGALKTPAGRTAIGQMLEAARSVGARIAKP